MNAKQISILAAILVIAAATFVILPSDNTDGVEITDGIIVTPVSDNDRLIVYVPSEYEGTITYTISGTDGTSIGFDNNMEFAAIVTGDSAAGVINGFVYDETVTYTINMTFPNGDTGSCTFGATEVVDPEITYTITWVNYDGTVLATSEVAEGETPAYAGETPVREADTENTYTFAGWEPTIVAAVADAEYTATFTATPIDTPVDPDEDPADRPFTNTITLSDGAVINASSSINASYTQEVVIAGDVTIADGGAINVLGKLTVLEGAVLTIEEGGVVPVTGDGIVDIQGDLIAEAGTADEPSFSYAGIVMTVSGTVTLEGADSFSSTGKGIEISGTFEVGDEATAYFEGATVAQGGELIVYGIADGTVTNNGTISIDSQGIPEGDAIDAAIDTMDLTIQIGSGATVDVVNLAGTVTVSDSELTFTEKRDQVPAKYNSNVVLSYVAGVTVTEDLTVQKNKEGVNEGINTMYVAGTVTYAVDYNATDGTGSIAIAGDNVEIIEDVVLSDDVSMTVSGKLKVSAEVTATAAAGQITVTGEITVVGKVTTVWQDQVGIAGEGIINASRYTTTSTPATGVYTTLETALADGATSITLLGANTVEGTATIPVGTTVTMNDGSKLTISEDATLTVAADGRNSARFNTSGVDTIDVKGTMVVQNLAKSRVSEESILSDTAKESEDSVTYTNIYNALDAAVDGETVEVTRGVPLTLTQDVEVRAGVTLYVPGTESVTVDHGVTVTVSGTVYAVGAFVIADEIEDDESTPDVDEAETAGTVAVSGMFLYTNGADYTADIVGAYFQYSYTVNSRDVSVAAIAPLASVPGIVADVESDIYLYGEMALGTIDFSAYDGEGDLTTIYAVNKMTVESLVIGEVTFDTTNATYVSGTIDMANGSVVLDNVCDIILANATDADDVTTSVISGTVDAYDNPETTTVTEKGTVTVSGEIVSDIGTAGEVTFDIPADATVTINTGAFIGPVTVEGIATIAGNDVEFASLTVIGTVGAEDQYVANADKMYIGMTAEDFAMAGTGDVSGVTLTSETTSVAYVSPNATVGEVFDNLEATAYYVGEDLYLTAYAIDGNAVAIKNAEFTVENAYFAGWQYENADGVMQSIVDTDHIGDYPEVYADIDYNVYTVVITVDEGIGTVAIDGNVLVNVWGNMFSMNGLSAGQHTVTYTLKSGFEGTPALVAVGENATASGLSFTLSGTPTDASGITVQLSLSGTEPADTTIVIDGGNNGGDDGMGLTDYLLIILVVLIVIMAIMVALRLMRS